MKTKNKSPLLKNTLTVHLFAIFSFISVISILIMNIMSRGSLLNDMLFGKDYFMDFYNSVYDASSRDVYIKTGVIYPPLANLFFYVISRMMPSELAQASLGDERLAMYSDGSAQMQFLFFAIFTVAVLIVVSYCVLKRGVSTFLALEVSFFMLFSFPVVYCLQRGNITLLVMAFCMAFCFFRNSENKIIRELSLIALAIAAGLKVYPALFGVLLLLDKKYKEAARLVLYGIFFFAAPFAFYGGIDTIKLLAKNIFSFAEKKSSGFNVNGTSISNALSWIYLLNDSDTTALASVLRPIIYVASAFTLIVSKEEWKKQLSIFFIFANIASVARVYILIFLLIPFISFVLTKSTKKITLVYGLIFCALIVAIPSYIYFNLDIVVNILAKYSIGAPAADMVKSMNKNTASLLILLFELLLFGETVITFIKSKSAKKSAAVQK